MAFKIFPTDSDVGVNTNDGRAFTEIKWSDLMLGGPRNRVISGFNMTINDPDDLDVTFSSGKAIVAGYLVESTSDITIAVNDLKTGYDNVFTLGLDRSNGLVTGASITEHGRNTARDEATCLGAVTGFSGTDTSIRRGKETHDNGEAFWLYSHYLGSGTAGNPSGDAWDTGQYWHVHLPVPFRPRSFDGSVHVVSGPDGGNYPFVGDGRSYAPTVVGTRTVGETTHLIGYEAGSANQIQVPTYYEWQLKIPSVTGMDYQIAVFR